MRQTIPVDFQTDCLKETMLSNRRAHPRSQASVSLVMLDSVARPRALIQIVLVCVLGATGCKTQAPSSEPSRATVRQARQAKQSKMDAARDELEQIPPPSKNRYLSVHSKEAYGNPFLVVHPQTVTMTIVYRDQDPNAFDAGGLLRPAKARRQEVDVRLDDLPQALASLAPDVWPYGRVVAIEESPTAPKTERVAIRRNVEATIQVLNDLGVVVDEWTGPNGALLR
jgi:hypothetical protein